MNLLFADYETIKNRTHYLQRFIPVKNDRERHSVCSHKKSLKGRLAKVIIPKISILFELVKVFF